jgi:D-alanyl-D-alanine carboxypeptidase (penicillin-binding protein 5/6)
MRPPPGPESRWGAELPSVVGRSAVTRPLGRRAALGVALLAAALVGTASSVPGDLLPRSHTPEPTPLAPGEPPSPLQTELHTPSPSTTPPRLGAASAVLADLDTGQVLFAKAPRARRPVASLVKVMTALLVLESAGLDDVVTVPSEAAAQTGSLAGLRPGERLRVEDLLYALLLGSANDAAVALADHVAGSVPAFVERMNRRARRLGMRDTRFASPTGLDAVGYSTAADLVRLVRAAYRWPEFARVVRTRVRDIPAPEGPPRRIQSRNVLLWLYPGAIGVKSGFTAAAAYTAAAAAERGGVRLLAVVLGSPVSAFDDAAALLDFGFTAFERATLLEQGQRVAEVRVGGRLVPVVAGADVVRLVRKGRLRDVEVAFVPAGSLVSPVDPGERVGRVVVLLARSRVASVPAVAGEPGPLGAPLPVQTEEGFRTALRLLTELLRAVVRAFL